jgi:hypothetical protein
LPDLRIVKIKNKQKGFKKDGKKRETRQLKNLVKRPKKWEIKKLRKNFCAKIKKIK